MRETKPRSSDASDVVDKVVYSHLDLILKSIHFFHVFLCLSKLGFWTFGCIAIDQGFLLWDYFNFKSGLDLRQIYCSFVCFNFTRYNLSHDIWDLVTLGKVFNLRAVMINLLLIEVENSIYLFLFLAGTIRD